MFPFLKNVVYNAKGNRPTLRPTCISVCDDTIKMCVTIRYASVVVQLIIFCDEINLTSISNSSDSKG